MALNSEGHVIVTGMHRSGTSCMTELLSLSGLNVGNQQDLMPADSHNERGYFENNKVVELNNELLSYLINQHATAVPHHTELAWITAPIVAFPNSLPTQLSDKIKELSQSLVSDAGYLLLKDPRFCLTLKYWKPHLKIKAVICMVRNPDSVAKSIHARDELPESLSKFAWFKYNGELKKTLSQFPHIFMSYEALLDNFEREVESLNNFFDTNGISFEITAAMRVCIDKRLNHSQSSNNKWQDVVLHQPIDEQAQNNQLDMIQASAHQHLSSYLIDSIISTRENKAFIDHLTSELDRINTHPVIGIILKAWRFLRHSTIGQYKEHK